MRTAARIVTALFVLTGCRAAADPPPAPAQRSAAPAVTAAAGRRRRLARRRRPRRLRRATGPDPQSKAVWIVDEGRVRAPGADDPR